MWKKILSEIWFLKKKLLHFFRVLIENFADFCQKMLSRRRVLSNVIFFPGKNSGLPTEVEGEGFSCSVWTFGRFVKTALYVSEWEFWLNCFLYEFFEFLHCFPTVGRTFFNIGTKTLENFREVVKQSCILLGQQNVSRKVCFFNKIFTFTILLSFDENLCRLLSESVPPDLNKCFQHSFRGSCCITLSFSSKKCTPTNGIWGKLFGLLWNFFDMVVKTVFLCPEVIFEENFFFFTKFS